MVFYLNEVGVCGGRVEGEGNESVYGGGFGEEFECPGLIEELCEYVCCLKRMGSGEWGRDRRTYLCVSELDKARLVLHDLVSFVFAIFE